MIGRVSSSASKVATMRDAIGRYLEDVREGRFPDLGTESFHVGGGDELRRLYAAGDADAPAAESSPIPAAEGGDAAGDRKAD